MLLKGQPGNYGIRDIEVLLTWRARTAFLHNTQAPKRELEEALIGVSQVRGGQVDSAATLSDEFTPRLRYQRQEVVAHKSITPELTDELAKTTFGYDTVEKLQRRLLSHRD